MAGNPNHPVVRELEPQWYKILAAVMFKENLNHVEITPELLTAMGDDDIAVVADARGGRLFIRLLPIAEAEKMARKEGGLPQ